MDLLKYLLDCRTTLTREEIERIIRRKIFMELYQKNVRYPDDPLGLNREYRQWRQRIAYISNHLGI